MTIFVSKSGNDTSRGFVLSVQVLVAAFCMFLSAIAGSRVKMAATLSDSVNYAASINHGNGKK